MATTPKKPTTAVKKKRTPMAKVGATAARTLDGRAIAMKMLLEGHKSPAIAERLGCSRQHAWTLAKEAMAELKNETLEDAATWRALLTAEHLEQLGKAKGLRESADLEKAQLGLTAADKALTQLRGLWVPTLPTSVKQELTGANGGPVEVGSPNLEKLDDKQLAQLEALLLLAASAETTPAAEDA